MSDNIAVEVKSYISLNKGFRTLVDADIYEEQGSFKWYAKRSYNLYYAARGLRKNGKVKTLLLHREIMGVTGGQEVHHIDGDTLNNLRCNLQLCSKQANLAYRKRGN